MPERVLVTGAAGFIGSHTVEALLGRGDEVIGVDNFDVFYDPAIKRENISQALRNSHFRIVEADIRNAAAVRGLMEATRPDVVVHLAARAGVRPSIDDPTLYMDVNVVGTSVLLDAAHASGVNRLVIASSSSVYGNDATAPFSESETAIKPVSPYAASKRSAELLCETFASLYSQLRLISLRFFTVYGPRQRPDLAIRKFTGLIAAGQPVPFFGDGSFSRDYTYITDTVQGVLGAIDRTSSSPPGHEIYNLGESATTSLSEIVALIENAVGRTAILHRLPAQLGDVAHTFADIRRARAMLGYAPHVPIADGIPLFVEWFRSRPIPAIS